MTLPLNDIRVIDAASYIAGPAAATVMGDFGADVIKVEPLQGDGLRTLAGAHATDYNWQLSARNKRSIALDMACADGQEILQALIASADVLIVNFLPAQLARFRLEYETLRVTNPRLIFAQLSGYGTAGPDANRRGFDSAAWWARSGMMDMTRDPGQAPLMGVPGFGDQSSAMALFGAIAMALYVRERTGSGSNVSSSLLANGVWANGLQVQGTIAGFDLAERRKKKGWLNPFTSVYRTTDDRYLILAMLNVAKEWSGLCQALQYPEWLSDPRFADARQLMKYRSELQRSIADRIGTLTLAEVTRRLDAHQVTHGVVTESHELLDDEQIRANEILVPTHSTDPGYPQTVNSPIWMEGVRKRCSGPAPAVGEHTFDVLAELGFEDGRLRELERRGVIGAALRRDD